MTEFKTNKVQALLAYLAVEANHAHECARLDRASEGSAVTNDLRYWRWGGRGNPVRAEKG